jgi:hypothetical protein
MPLLELQRAFWDAVRTRGAPPEMLSDFLTGSAKQTPAERLGVYHRAYWQRQVSALSATFPCLQHLLGAPQCERLLLSYIEARPGSEPCIERLGAGFVEFLTTRADVPAKLLGVARLEWALVASLLAPDPPCVAELPRGLGASFAECRLELVPSLHVEHVPAASLSAFAPEQARDMTTLAQSASIDVAFFRPHFAVLHVALQPDEARAHALARAGATIAVICSAFAGLPPTQAAERALQVLSNWFARGWIAQCRT